MSKRGENIRKRKDGRWEARYVKSRTLEGKAEYGYIYGRTYEEVKTRKLLAQQQVKNCLIPIKSMSMKQLFTEWLGSIRHTVKESSFALYETMIEKHLLPWFGKCRLGHITTEMIQNFSVEKLRLGFSARTVRCILMTMRSAMSYGEKMGYLSMGDVQIRYPKIAAEQSFRVLSENQLEQLVEYLLGAENRIAAGILISVYSGIRVGELCGLQWRDLDFDNGIMKITKTVSRIKNLNIEQPQKEKKPKAGTPPRTVVMITTPKSASSVRDIPIPDFLLQKLMPYRGEEDAFVLTGDHTCMEPRGVQRKFQSILKRCGIPDINIHSLRHAFASRCTEMGLDSKTLSELLGHSSVKITMDIYVHSTMKQKKNCINQLSY